MQTVCSRHYFAPHARRPRTWRACILLLGPLAHLSALSTGTIRASDAGGAVVAAGGGNGRRCRPRAAATCARGVEAALLHGWAFYILAGAIACGANTFDQTGHLLAVDADYHDNRLPSKSVYNESQPMAHSRYRHTPAEHTLVALDHKQTLPPWSLMQSAPVTQAEQLARHAAGMGAGVGLGQQPHAPVALKQRCSVGRHFTSLHEPSPAEGCQQQQSYSSQVALVTQTRALTMRRALSCHHAAGTVRHTSARARRRHVHAHTLLHTPTRKQNGPHTRSAAAAHLGHTCAAPWTTRTPCRLDH